MRLTGQRRLAKDGAGEVNRLLLHLIRVRMRTQVLCSPVDARASLSNILQIYVHLVPPLPGTARRGKQIGGSLGGVEAACVGSKGIGELSRDRQQRQVTN